MLEIIHTKRNGDNADGYIRLIDITVLTIVSAENGLYEIGIMHTFHPGTFRLADIAFTNFDDAICYVRDIHQEISQITNN